MTLHLHRLHGCSPVPLANYLKALGVLRLVSEQADRDARGWWNGERFCFLTRLSREELETFLLDRYEPTPLLSPWNKGSGFFKANDPGLRPLEDSTASRLAKFRNAVMEAKHLLDEISLADAAIRAAKARTKTNLKSFQSSEQRELLQNDPTYRRQLLQLHEQFKKPGMTGEESDRLSEEIHVLESLTATTSAPPSKREAEALKASEGYRSFLAVAERRFKALKTALIPDCRRQWRGPHADWLASSVVLDEDGNPQWPSLLGTGGNDGNLDFTNNFMQRLGSVIDLHSPQGAPTEDSKSLLHHSLWREPTRHLENAAVGQFNPGGAGGPNSTTGFTGSSLVNAWDFVLMMEGTLLFASRITRRLDRNSFSRASSPFAVNCHTAGFSTPGAEKSLRGEQWMPLWDQPATFRELQSLMGEARAQLGRRTANRPLEMVRAITRQGVARGVRGFVRYGYLERNGLSTLAVPLGRIAVVPHAHAFLLDDIAAWVERLVRRGREKGTPERFTIAERRLSDSIFAAMTQGASATRWQSVLMAAAEIEMIQAAGAGYEAGPIPPLRPEWISAAAEDSPEFRLALSLGSAAGRYTIKGHPIDPIRHHFLPLEQDARRFRTSEKRLFRDPRVCVSCRDSIGDLAAVVDRRLVEATRGGRRRLPLVAAPGCEARWSDLAAFLRGDLNLERILLLARALMAIKWSQWSSESVFEDDLDEAPDPCWLALRLCCLPWPLSETRDIPADERIVRLLLRDESSRAIDGAIRRLRTEGIRASMIGGIVDRSSSRLWAAALAFPIHRRAALCAASILDPTMKGLLCV